jgi:hypothetical protein
MAKRNLRIVPIDHGNTLGICDGCNQQFRSGAPSLDLAKHELTTMFDAHKCEPLDESQNAARIVREATEGK